MQRDVPYYHKIENLYKRDPNTFKYDVTKINRPEFELLGLWDVSEKVDGMSVHIELPGPIHSGAPFYVYGRSSNTQFHQKWLDVMNPLGHSLTDKGLNADSTCRIYGELYGPGINSGGGYGGGIRFAAFDISFGTVFVNPQVFHELCQQNDIPTVPRFGHMWFDEIDKLVQEGFQSKVTGARVQAEGIIAKSPVELRNNAGKRLMFKHKSADF